MGWSVLPSPMACWWWVAYSVFSLSVIASGCHDPGGTVPVRREPCRCSSTGASRPSPVVSHKRTSTAGDKPLTSRFTVRTVTGGPRAGTGARRRSATVAGESDVPVTCDQRRTSRIAAPSTPNMVTCSLLPSSGRTTPDVRTTPYARVSGAAAASADGLVTARGVVTSRPPVSVASSGTWYAAWSIAPAKTTDATAAVRNAVVATGRSGRRIAPSNPIRPATDPRGTSRAARRALGAQRWAATSPPTTAASTGSAATKGSVPSASDVDPRLAPSHAAPRHATPINSTVRHTVRRSRSGQSRTAEVTAAAATSSSSIAGHAEPSACQIVRQTGMSAPLASPAVTPAPSTAPSTAPARQATPASNPVTVPTPAMRAPRRRNTATRTAWSRRRLTAATIANPSSNTAAVPPSSPNLRAERDARWYSSFSVSSGRTTVALSSFAMIVSATSDERRTYVGTPRAMTRSTSRLVTQPYVRANSDSGSSCDTASAPSPSSSGSGPGSSSPLSTVGSVRSALPTTTRPSEATACAKVASLPPPSATTSQRVGVHDRGSRPLVTRTAVRRSSAAPRKNVAPFWDSWWKTSSRRTGYRDSCAIWPRISASNAAAWLRL